MHSVFVVLLFSLFAWADDAVPILRTARARSGADCAYLTAKLAGEGDAYPFVTNIMANPADDTVRLVYADFLDEAGGENNAKQAELLRKQVELSQILLRAGVDQIEYLSQRDIYRARQLDREVRAILKDYGKAWSAKMFKKIPGMTAVEFRRGIVEGIELDLNKMDSYLVRNSGKETSFLTENPEVRHVLLKGVTAERLLRFLQLAGVDHLEHLTVEVSGPPAVGGEVAVLATSSVLHHLRRLDFTNPNVVGEANLRILAQSPHLAAVRTFGRPDRYFNYGNAQAHREALEAWILNEGGNQPFPLRRDAFLSLVDQGEYTIDRLPASFPNLEERARMWEVALSHGVSRRQLAEESLFAAQTLFSSVPESLRGRFAEVYLQHHPTLLSLARDLAARLEKGNVKEANDLAFALLTSPEVEKGAPRASPSRPELHLIYLLAQVHQQKAKLDDYRKAYDQELNGASNWRLFLELASGKQDALKSIHPAAFEYRRVEAGTFPAGSTGKDSITLTKDFEMQAAPLTVGQFEILRERFEKKTGRPFHSLDAYSANRPLTNLTFADARALADLLTELDPAYRYEIPTSAQWEVAIRAGTTSINYYGDSYNRALLSRYVNVGFGGAPKDIARLRPNPLGMYDMGGNVKEWTRSRYPPNAGPRFGVDPNFQGSDLGEVRGASSFDALSTASSVSSQALDSSAVDVGVRFVRVRK